MRFHMLQNAQMALDFLRYKKIKLVNIRAEDIVDGNPKLTLGLIWTIILHFQVSDMHFFFFIFIYEFLVHHYNFKFAKIIMRKRFIWLCSPATYFRLMDVHIFFIKCKRGQK